jgi:hypothetical protein
MDRPISRLPRLRAARRPHAGLVALALLLPLLAAACADKGPPPPCPRVVGVPGSQSVSRYSPAGRDLTDVVYEATFQNAVLSCTYDGDAIDADMQVTIVAARGPANVDRKAALAYFVAVATRDNNVLARKEFDLEIPFPEDKTRIAAVEEISQHIPLKEGQTGADYVIYVGLALTPDELKYNLGKR